LMETGRQHAHGGHIRFQLVLIKARLSEQ
jgi:hypothetical protein